MSDEGAFLRAILADPEEPANRLVYADWLEERGDPRAAFLRGAPDVGRINYVNWLASRFGSLDYYFELYPELQRQYEERQATAEARERLRATCAAHPEWLAFMESLGCPFRPFFFWNNTGPRSFQPEELPFTQPIGTRGAVVTFASDFWGDSWEPGLMHDLHLLTQLQLTECASGAAICPVHPFIGELATDRQQITAADGLAALKTRDFQSEHIQTLDAHRIPYPGYHPGTANDEIHTDFNGQVIFPNEEGQDEFADTHGTLKRLVKGEHLWYVLLHAGPKPCNYVVLFAVGRSHRGNRLLGVVTHQMCHNLCD